MNQTEKLVNQIETMVAGLKRALEDGKLTEEDLNLAYESMKRSQKCLKSITDKFEKSIKEILKFKSEYKIGDREYFYEYNEARVFDTNKVKKELKKLNYHIDDFYTLQNRKSLKWQNNNIKK